MAQAGFELALGVGIAQGYTTIGAIGTVTNLAARLCGEAKGGQILVSSRVVGPDVQWALRGRTAIPDSSP